MSPLCSFISNAGLGTPVTCHKDESQVMSIQATVLELLRPHADKMYSSNNYDSSLKVHMLCMQKSGVVASCYLYDFSKKLGFPSF